MMPDALSYQLEAVAERHPNNPVWSENGEHLLVLLLRNYCLMSLLGGQMSMLLSQLLKNS
jgi:hypothetical protein